jgi:hypothetical protein
MIYVAAKFPQLGDDLSIIRLTILEAYRAGRGDTADKTYTHLADVFTRKMQVDLSKNNMDIDEFRRISRGLDAIATYLDNREH